MCVSAVIEIDVAKLERLMQASHLASSFEQHPASEEATSHRRIEPNAMAPIVRMGPSGLLVAEPMRFKSYVVKRETMAGDMFADSMLTRNHGVIVLRTFSEWVSAQRLIESHLIPEHEIHCAFNRYASNYAASTHSQRDRMVLGNFTPADDGYLVVPVLFSPSEREGEPAEFVIVSEEPNEALASLGVRLTPVTLGRESGLSWLSTSAGDDAEDVDFQAVLRDGGDESLAFTLYKAAG